MKISILDPVLYCSTGICALDVDDNLIHEEKALPALPNFYRNKKTETTI